MDEKVAKVQGVPFLKKSNKRNIVIMGFKKSNSLETSCLKISQNFNLLEPREYRGEKNFESQAVITTRTSWMKK